MEEKLKKRENRYSYKDLILMTFGITLFCIPLLALGFPTYKLGYVQFSLIIPLLIFFAIWGILKYFFSKLITRNDSNAKKDECKEDKNEVSSNNSSIDISKVILMFSSFLVIQTVTTLIMAILLQDNSIILITAYADIIILLTFGLSEIFPWPSSLKSKIPF